MTWLGIDRFPARGSERAPRWGRDCGQCEICGGIDDSVQFCVHPACEATLHRECATRCYGCNEVVCAEHVVVFDELRWCPVCAKEQRVDLEQGGKVAA